jgi:hypothetical protein
MTPPVAKAQAATLATAMPAGGTAEAIQGGPASPDLGIAQPQAATLLPPMAKPLHLNELGALRKRCYGLATAVLSALPVPLTASPWEQGYGFYIDVPTTPIQDEMQYYAFWLLFGIAEQHHSSERIKLARGMRFADMLMANQQSQANRLIGEPATLPVLGSGLLMAKRLPDTALLDLFQLIQWCRQMRLSFRESDLLNVSRLSKSNCVMPI